GGFRGGLVAIAADEDDGAAFGFAHEETGGSGKFIGDGENCGRKKLAIVIARAAQVMEDWHAGCADGNVCQAQAPGAAKRVADDDGNVFARSLTKSGSEFFRRLIGISRKEGYDVFAGDVRMVYTCIGTD